MSEAAANLIIGVCLDESGSMRQIEKETIEGFNGFIDNLRKQEGQTRLSLTTFSLRGQDVPTYRPLSVVQALDEFQALDDRSYKPYGDTPLYDAVAHTINGVEQTLPTLEGDWTVLFVIQTDGRENSSREFTRGQVFDLIRKKERDGWKFVYLGADQDIYEAATASSVMGMSVGSTVTYDKASTSSTYSGLARATAGLRTNSGMSSRDFAESTQKERDKDAEEEATKSGRDESTPNF